MDINGVNEDSQPSLRSFPIAPSDPPPPPPPPPPLVDVYVEHLTQCLFLQRRCRRPGNSRRRHQVVDRAQRETIRATARSSACRSRTSTDSARCSVLLVFARRSRRAPRDPRRRAEQPPSRATRLLRRLVEVTVVVRLARWLAPRRHRTGACEGWRIRRAGNAAIAVLSFDVDAESPSLAEGRRTPTRRWS